MIILQVVFWKTISCVLLSKIEDFQQVI